MKLYSPECLHGLKYNYFIKSPGRTLFPLVQMIRVNLLEPVTTDKFDKLYIFFVPDGTFLWYISGWRTESDPAEHQISVITAPSCGHVV